MLSKHKMWDRNAVKIYKIWEMQQKYRKSRSVQLRLSVFFQKYSSVNIRLISTFPSMPGTRPESVYCHISIR